MRILVTGSHGFIGKNLVGALKYMDHDVIECDIRSPDPSSVLWDTFKGDLDAIYHLACVNQEHAVDQPQANILVNAFGAKKMAELAKEKGAKLIYTSTASVYGNATEIPTPVDAKLDPKTDYAVAKLAGEQFIRNSGANWTIFRLSNVYGPHQTTDNPYCGVVAKFFESALHGQPLKIYGDGLQTRDFTFVTDVIHDLLLPIDPKAPNYSFSTHNVSYGRETSILELGREISRLCGADYRVEFAPERSVDGIERRCLAGWSFDRTHLRHGLEYTLQWIIDEEEDISGRIGRSTAVS